MRKIDTLIVGTVVAGTHMTGIRGTRPARIAFRTLHLGAAAILGLAVLALVGGAPASAQQILVMVQGRPITNFDVAQRIKLMQITERQTLTQKQALDQLIDDRLKIFTAQRFGVEMQPADIDKMFASIASRSGRTAAQFSEALAAQGLSDRMMKSKLNADYVWGSYVRARFSSATSVRDSDVFAALNAKGADTTQAQRATEYTIRQIVLVVGRTDPPQARAQRLAEANALRARFNDCDAGIAEARAMREVVVRDPVIRTSPDVAAPLRKILDDTPIGRTTPPEVTRAGIEMVAICNKREVVGDSVQKKEVQSELQTKQFEQQSARLLEEARKGALIEYR
jgi:peptidyl-prolyl cis-trans isomerase SurA